MLIFFFLGKHIFCFKPCSM